MKQPVKPPRLADLAPKGVLLGAPPAELWGLVESGAVQLEGWSAAGRASWSGELVGRTGRAGLYNTFFNCKTLQLQGPGCCFTTIRDLWGM